MALSRDSKFSKSLQEPSLVKSQNGREENIIIAVIQINLTHNPFRPNFNKLIIIIMAKIPTAGVWIEACVLAWNNGQSLMKP